ncbi:hypothetical protein [Methylorubrum populi]|uniref:hypothetical protein n=1 Tax=Methylorubrum populi TaxID=223967 RepID=UPI001FEE7B90|nr:hypothetical protein [Methylorubrum populi]
MAELARGLIGARQGILHSRRDADLALVFLVLGSRCAAFGLLIELPAQIFD